jgi:hypothetical protein
MNHTDGRSRNEYNRTLQLRSLGFFRSEYRVCSFRNELQQLSFAKLLGTENIYTALSATSTG